MRRRRIRRRRTRGWGLSFFPIQRRYSKAPNPSSETNEETKRIRYPTFRQVIQVYKRIIEETGGEFGILSEGNLRFTLDFVKYYGEDVFDKVAYLMYNIVVLHPFVNGNKRTAIVLAEAFLRDNGWQLVYDEEEAKRFLLEIASGQRTLEDVKAWIKKHAKHISEERATQAGGNHEP